MADKLGDWLGALSSLLWGHPVTLYGLLGVGLFLSLRLFFVQLRCFKLSWRVLWRGTGRGAGEISGFQALATMLSATVGTGNIAGVATALTLGGPGALFWMWVTAFLGMATKFAECTLAVRFRELRPNGEVAGGPMYTLVNGLGWRRMAFCFALFAMIASFGIGNMVQANSIADNTAYMFPSLHDKRWLPGLMMALLVAVVILGGVRRIAVVAAALAPAMALLYVGGALSILLTRSGEIPGLVSEVVRSAFSLEAAGGAVAGEALRWGVARGLFSNEAGLGSSPMAMAAARFRHPVQGGLVAMLGPFIDTLVICSMTGLVLLAGGVLERPPLDPDGAALTGAALTSHAFQLQLGPAGATLVQVSLCLFAFSTMLAWSYYGDRCADFLFGARAIRPYRLIFVALVFVGAMAPLRLVWDLADITNLLMAVPNLLAVLALSGLVWRLTRKYTAAPNAPGAREP